MYGRIFETMFEGSMVGAGCPTFAVWSYVITKMRADRDVGAQVDLNPVLLSAVLGEKVEVLEKVIEKLCRPDAKSRSPDKEGRRLVRLGQFSYQVVNGAKYIAIRNKDEQRRSDRERKKRERAKPSGNGAPLAGEKAYERILETEGQAAADKFMESMSSSSTSNEEAKVNTVEIRKAVAMSGTMSPEPTSPHNHEGEQGDSPLDLPEGETQEG
jgi:hypothetical protein